MNYCYLNGKIIPENEAKVSVNDIGLLRGYGVFDFLRSYNGKPFMLDWHLQRLENSAAKLNLEVPLTRQEIADIITDLLQENNGKNVGIKLLLTGGESEDGTNYGANNPTFYILVKDLPSYPKAYYEEGVKLITFAHQREIPEAKTINYITMLSLNKAKKDQKALEVLYTSRGFVLEGASCNFFIFKGDTLITPKDNILEGTKRRIILKITKDYFQNEARDLKIEELTDATEAFICSTTRDIMPVTQIDDYKIGDGKVGKNTKIVMDLYQEFVNKNS